MRRCPEGSGISDKEVCIEACKKLDIPLSGKRFKNGKPCYKGGSGVCNQNGAFAGRSSLICCKEERKMMQQSWYFAELDKQRKKYICHILSMKFILFPILAIDCVWGEWVAGQCSTTCGIGSRVSTRKKLVEEANGGNCSGRSTKTEECNVQECPGNDLKYLR